MKTNLSILIFLFSYSILFGQSNSTKYFTKKNEETTKIEDAYYYRILSIDMDIHPKIIVEEKFISTNKIKLAGIYNNIKDKKFVDQKIQAYENGKIKSKEKYSEDGVLIDTSYHYHENGKLKLCYNYPYKIVKNSTKVTDTLILLYQDSTGKRHLVNGNGYAEEGSDDIEKGDYKNYKRTGEWKGSFMNNQYHFVESYNEGKLISGVSKDSMNNEFPYDIKTYMRQPDYPGGIHKFRSDILNRYIYPKEALTMKVSGTVKLSFVINKEGQLEKIKVEEDLGYGTGEAGINALKKSKKWTPGIMRGIPVNVAYALPIRLGLN